MDMDQVLESVQSELLMFAPRLLRAVLVFLLFWGAGVFLHGVLRKLGDRADGRRRGVLRLVARVARGVLVVLGVTTAIEKLGIAVAPLVATLGLTGFALGFACRDALSNLLAGVLLIIYRPFGEGDRIAVAGFDGTVSDIDLRYTSLEADGKRILIPNSVLFTNAIRLEG